MLLSHTVMVISRLVSSLTSTLTESQRASWAVRQTVAVSDGERVVVWVSCHQFRRPCSPAHNSRAGEGYGDFLATLIRMKDGKVHDFDMGAWAAHRAGGIRPHPYSTNQTVNPDTYKTLDRPGYFGVHAIGSVYAEYLFEVAEALIVRLTAMHATQG